MATAREPQAVRFSRFGPPKDVLSLDRDNVGPTGPGQIRVQMIAAPIHPADLNRAEGTYGIKTNLPAVGGIEGVGQVVEVGSGVSNLSRGDIVVPLSAEPLGTWRHQLVADAGLFGKIPGSLEPEIAACLTVGPGTALRLLEDFVQLKPGDVILQNGGAGSVGTAVAQIAKSRGLRVVSIIRSRPIHLQTPLIERLKALGNEAVLTDDYIETAGARKLLRDLPRPRLALNAIGGASATALARYLAPGGTMVTYGAMSRKPVQIPSSLFIFNDVILRGFHLARWLQKASPQERSAMLDQLVGMVRQGALNFAIERVAFSDFNIALQRAQDPLRDRKIVLVMDK